MAYYSGTIFSIYISFVLISSVLGVFELDVTLKFTQKLKCAENVLTLRLSKL